MQKDGSLLALGFRYALDRYDFDNTTANWKAIHRANLALASRWKINDKWLWANYGIVGIAAEEGSDKDKGFVFNYLSIRIAVNSRLQKFLGKRDLLSHRSSLLRYAARPPSR